MTQTTTRHFNVHCRGCDRTASVPSKRTAFCPHCGRRLRSMPPMAKVVLTTSVLAFATAAGLRGFSRPSASGSHPAPQPAVDARPVRPSDAVLADAQSARAARLAELNQRAAVIRSARQPLVDQVTELSNLASRLTTAVTRANDEDRWPVKAAGRTLDRAEADALVAQLSDVLAGERQAIDHDGEVLGRVTAAEAQLQGEVADIDRLRQQEPSAEVQRQAQAYRDRLPQLPDTADLMPDPAVPVDVNALLK